MSILLAELLLWSPVNANLSLMFLLIYVWSVFQTVPQVDDEGYSIRPDNPTQSILDVSNGNVIGKLTSVCFDSLSYRALSLCFLRTCKRSSSMSLIGLM